MPDFLYIIGAADADTRQSTRLKIGITCNLEKRLGDMQSHSPVLLMVHASWSFKDRRRCMGIEAALHNEFKAQHSHGEWFELELPHVIRAVKRAIRENHVWGCQFTGSLDPGKPKRKWRDGEQRRLKVLGVAA